MAEVTVFDQLVKSLDSEERKRLLDRLLASQHVSTEPLKPEADEDGIVDLDSEYRRLPFFRRLVVLLRALIAGRDRYAVLEEALLHRVEVVIEHRSPGLMDFRRSMFTERMYEQIMSLRDGLQGMRAPLDLAMRREKTEFIAFLAGVEMPEVQARLLEASDPSRLWDERGDLESGALKMDVLRRCEETLDAVPKDDRRGVYYDIQALTGLAQLAIHPFGSMLSRFRRTNEIESQLGEFDQLARYLAPMAEVLTTAQYPPSEDALRAVFLYAYRDQLLDTRFDLEEHLESDLNDAEEAFGRIREFNAAVPVVSIVKAATRNLSYKPRAGGGGEDWFVIYKSFWKRRASRNYGRFYRKKKEEQLARRAAGFLGFRKLPPLVYYTPDQFEDLVILKHNLSLSFLKGFFHKVFKRITKTLNLILSSGDFYKSENKREFADALAYLGLIEDNLGSFESRLSPEGDLGMQLQQARKDTRNPAARGRKIHAVAEQADRNATYLVSECYKKLLNLSQILAGILHGRSAERYDTLANLSSIGGVGNKLLISTWNEALEQVLAAVNILRDTRGLEEGPVT